jgi:hypothetical protein
MVRMPNSVSVRSITLPPTGSWWRVCRIGGFRRPEDRRGHGGFLFDRRGRPGSKVVEVLVVATILPLGSSNLAQCDVAGRHWFGSCCTASQYEWSAGLPGTLFLKLAIDKSAVGAIASGLVFTARRGDRCRRLRKTSLRTARRPPAPPPCLPAAIGHVGDVVAEAAVAAFVMADEVAVTKTRQSRYTPSKSSIKRRPRSSAGNWKVRRYQATLLEWQPGPNGLKP